MLELTLLHAQALQGDITSFNPWAIQDLAASYNQVSKTHQDPSTGSASDCSEWLLQLSSPLLIYIAKANQKLDVDLQESGRAAHS